MEDFGIYKTYVGMYLLFILFVIPQAVCQNFATLIVTRVIAGSLGGVLQNVVDGIIADMFEGEQARSLPVTLYIFCLVGGVSFGPVLGGAVISRLYWRW
jgi:MFS family permease